MSDKFVQRKITLHLPVFNYDVEIVLSSDVQTARASHKGISGEYVRDDVTLAICWNAISSPLSIVFLPFEADIGYVVHELFHVVWRVMEYIGAKHENEIMAYHIGYLSREVVRFIVKTGNPTEKHEKPLTEVDTVAV